MPFGIKFGQSNRNQSQSKVGPTSSSASSSATAVALSKPIQSPLSPTPERSMDHKIVARSLKSSESIADKKMKKSKEPKHLTTKQQQQPPAISPTTMIVRKKFDQYDSHQRIQSPNRSDISGNDPNEIHRMAQSNIQKSITNNIDGSSINIIDNSNEIIVGGVSVGIDRNSIPINLVRNKIGDYGDNDDILSSLNQTNLLHSHQQQQQPPQPPSTVVSQSPPTSVKSLGPNSINQIPTSRSFDRSNEAYRLAANQSNIHNGSEYQAYRNRLAKPRPIFGGRLPSSVAMKMEDNVSSDRKDNLGDSDHGESNDRDDDQINLRQHQHQHQQQQQYQQQSENSRTKSIVDDNRPSVPSKPPILPRQTSTMTPVTASKPIQLPASNNKFVLNAMNDLIASSNGSVPNRLSGNIVNGQMILNLPKGGGEVLIDGSRHHNHHHRSRSAGNRTTNTIVSKYKNFHTSSSIDVAVTEKIPLSSSSSPPPSTSTTSKSNRSINEEDHRTQTTRLIRSDSIDSSRNKQQQQTSTSSSIGNKPSSLATTKTTTTKADATVATVLAPTPESIHQPSTLSSTSSVNRQQQKNKNAQQESSAKHQSSSSSNVSINANDDVELVRPARPTRPCPQQSQPQLINRAQNSSIQNQFDLLRGVQPQMLQSHPFQTIPNLYNQTSSNSLFDEDPGIMSEIETSATGFRRSNKIRSSLPIVRTPSKSQDRSMGLVFLQFRNETKRALLPNEITSIDTVKALFVRSFPRQLSMEYLDHISVRIYIHDPNKDMFYELEDLRDVKDRCILRIYEQGVNGPQPGGGLIHQSLIAQNAPNFTMANAAARGPHDGENYGYFSEPEFDSDYQSQHIHRKRFPPPPPLPPTSIVGQSLMLGQNPLPHSQYYGTIMLPSQYRSATLGPRSANFFMNPISASSSIPGHPHQPPPPLPSNRTKPFQSFSQTLPRGKQLISPNNSSGTNPINPYVQQQQSQQAIPPKPQRSFPNNPMVISSPQQQQQHSDIIMIQSVPARPVHLQASQTISSPNESQPMWQGYHQSRPLPDRPYSVAGHYPTSGLRFSLPPNSVSGPQINDGSNPIEFSGYLSSPEHHHRPPVPPPSSSTLISIPAPGIPNSFPSTRFFDPRLSTNGAIVGPISNPANDSYLLRRTTDPTNVVVDDEARAKMSEIERKIVSLTNVVSKALTTTETGKSAAAKFVPSYTGRNDIQSSNLSSENLNQLRSIRRKTRELRNEIRQLKRFTIQRIGTTRESIRSDMQKICSTIDFFSQLNDSSPIRLERLKINATHDAYNDDAIRLDKDLLELEAQVEALRSNVINRRCRVNMSNVESMAMILSRASKTVADLKSRYPLLAQNLKSIMTKELHEIEKEEKFLREEPDRLEHSLKRCKKLTGTLVTLKRLASVQEQRSSSNNQTSSPSLLLSENLQQSKDSGGSGDEISTSTTNHLTKRRDQMSRSYDKESMGNITNNTSTVIQVTPATPLQLNEKEKLSSSTILDNLLDELQTISKQSMPNQTSISNSSSIGGDDPIDHRSSSTPNHQRQKSSIQSTKTLNASDSDTIIRRASRSKSFSSIRATSEPPGTRTRGLSIPDGGKLDLESIAMLASTCGNAAAATAALVEKRFAQSRQELLEQRHQALLHKQKKLQEQYTKLQQLSKRPINSKSFALGLGLTETGIGRQEDSVKMIGVSELKKTGSESNIVAKFKNDGSIVIDDDLLMRKRSPTMSTNDPNENKSTIQHGSMHDLKRDSSKELVEQRMNIAIAEGDPKTIETNSLPFQSARKTFETEIL